MYCIIASDSIWYQSYICLYIYSTYYGAQSLYPDTVGAHFNLASVILESQNLRLQAALNTHFQIFSLLLALFYVTQSSYP